MSSVVVLPLRVSTGSPTGSTERESIPSVSSGDRRLSAGDPFRALQIYVDEGLAEKINNTVDLLIREISDREVEASRQAGSESAPEIQQAIQKYRQIGAHLKRIFQILETKKWRHPLLNNYRDAVRGQIGRCEKKLVSIKALAQIEAANQSFALLEEAFQREFPNKQAAINYQRQLLEIQRRYEEAYKLGAGCSFTTELRRLQGILFKVRAKIDQFEIPEYVAQMQNIHQRLAKLSLLQEDHLQQIVSLCDDWLQVYEKLRAIASVEQDELKKVISDIKKQANQSLHPFYESFFVEIVREKLQGFDVKGELANSEDVIVRWAEIFSNHAEFNRKWISLSLNGIEQFKAKIKANAKIFFSKKSFFPCCFLGKHEYAFKSLNILPAQIFKWMNESEKIKDINARF